MWFRKPFAPFVFLLSVLVACTSPTAAPATVTSVSQGEAPRIIPLHVGYGVRGPWYELYFTDPANPSASQESGGPDMPLVEAIDAARVSVDVAAYSLSLTSVRDALLRAYDRGVAVRVVMESDARDNAAPQRLIRAGIPVLGDRREGLMHDKFVIIDRSEVWTGSMNFTFSGAYHDNNNLIRIRSTRLAEDYLTEFNEMFIEDHFGEDGSTKTPYPHLTIDGTPIEVYFSPDDGVEDRLKDLLSEAQESIFFLAYSFTSDALGEVIREQAGAGVSVMGVMDADQVNSNIGTEYDPFRQIGLDVRLDGNDGLMHHKVIIIDEQIVVTGSYNFSRSAEERNDENVLILFDPQIAQQYLQEFWRVYRFAQP
ncbi:MAG: DUF1669 domain-containing protein [Anaerolineae bacterium]|nr:MAG: DUF1669 domain-containing protein [Anaerolineae bacterium]